MEKNFIISVDVYTDLCVEQRSIFNNTLLCLKDLGHKIIFTSRDRERINELSDLKGQGFLFYRRDTLKEKLNSKEINKENIIIIGNKDYDLYTAATTKSFFIVPLWCEEIQEKPKYYGLKVDSVQNLEKLIAIVLNQNTWFFELNVDDKTKVLSLTSANTLGNHSEEEIEMINGFRDYLKSGQYSYYEVLLYHFLSGISNRPEFREIQDWSIVPSSGTNLNQEMLNFKEKARYLMNGRKKENIFIRHTATLKSHESYKNGIDRIPCDRHFDTIAINPVYKNKLKDRVVCIFDDYSTKGTSFEVVRNLLLKEGVKKIYCVSLGRFGNNNSPYIKQDYNIDGDLTKKKGYDYSLISREYLYGKIDNEAIKEVENLHHIIYGY